MAACARAGVPPSVVGRRALAASVPLRAPYSALPAQQSQQKHQKQWGRTRIAPRVAASAAGAGGGGAPADVSAEALHERFRGAKRVFLTSTQQEVDVTSLWGPEERAVLFFGRSMVRACARVVKHRPRSTPPTLPPTRTPPPPPPPDPFAGSWHARSLATCCQLSTPRG